MQQEQEQGQEQGEREQRQDQRQQQPQPQPQLPQLEQQQRQFYEIQQQEQLRQPLFPEVQLSDITSGDGDDDADGCGDTSTIVSFSNSDNDADRYLPTYHPPCSPPQTSLLSLDSSTSLPLSSQGTNLSEVGSTTNFAAELELRAAELALRDYDRYEPLEESSPSLDEYSVTTGRPKLKTRNHYYPHGDHDDDDDDDEESMEWDFAVRPGGRRIQQPSANHNHPSNRRGRRGGGAGRGKRSKRKGAGRGVTNAMKVHHGIEGKWHGYSNMTFSRRPARPPTARGRVMLRRGKTLLQCSNETNLSSRNLATSAGVAAEYQGRRVAQPGGGTVPYGNDGRFNYDRHWEQHRHHRHHRHQHRGLHNAQHHNIIGTTGGHVVGTTTTTASAAHHHPQQPHQHYPPPPLPPPTLLQQQQSENGPRYEYHTASTTAAFVTFLKALFGVGLMSQPSIIGEVGVTLGAISYAIIAIGCTFACYVLLEARNDAEVLCAAAAAAAKNNDNNNNSNNNTNDISNTTVGEIRTGTGAQEVGIEQNCKPPCVQSSNANANVMGVNTTMNGTTTAAADTSMLSDTTTGAHTTSTTTTTIAAAAAGGGGGGDDSAASTSNNNNNNNNTDGLVTYGDLTRVLLGPVTAKITTLTIVTLHVLFASGMIHVAITNLSTVFGWEDENSYRHNNNNDNHDSHDENGNNNNDNNDNGSEMVSLTHRALSCLLLPIIIMLLQIPRLANLFWISAAGLAIYITGCVGSMIVATIRSSHRHYQQQQEEQEQEEHHSGDDADANGDGGGGGGSGGHSYFDLIPPDAWEMKWDGIPIFVASTVYAVEGINLALPTVNSLSNKQMAIPVVCTAVMFYGLITLTVGMIGYFGGMGGWNDYHEDGHECRDVSYCFHSSVVRTVHMSCLAVALILTLPVILYPSTEMLEIQLYKRKMQRWWESKQLGAAHDGGEGEDYHQHGHGHSHGQYRYRDEEMSEMELGPVARGGGGGGNRSGLSTVLLPTNKMGDGNRSGRNNVREVKFRGEQFAKTTTDVGHRRRRYVTQKSLVDAMDDEYDDDDDEFYHDDDDDDNDDEEEDDNGEDNRPYWLYNEDDYYYRYGEGGVRRGYGEVTDDPPMTMSAITTHYHYYQEDDDDDDNSQKLSRHWDKYQPDPLHSPPTYEKNWKLRIVLALLISIVGAVEHKFSSAISFIRGAGLSFVGFMLPPVLYICAREACGRGVKFTSKMMVALAMLIGFGCFNMALVCISSFTDNDLMP